LPAIDDTYSYNVCVVASNIFEPAKCCGSKNGTTIIFVVTAIASVASFWHWHLLEVLQHSR